MEQRFERLGGVSGSLGAIVSRALGANAADYRIDIRRPIDHQSNRLYDVWFSDRHFIAKEFVKPDEASVAPNREYRELRLLEPLDVAPRPVFFDPTLGPVILYEYLAGEMWDRRRPSDHDLDQLAKLWLTVAAVPTDGLWMSHGYERSWTVNETRLQAGLKQYADWTVDAFPSGSRAAELCLDVARASRDISRTLEAIPPVLCFCRSDPRFANVISRPDGRLAMVYWEDCGLRDPTRDVADLQTHPNQGELLTADDWEAFLESFFGARDLADPTLKERVDLYLAIFPVFWLSVLLGHGVSLAASGRLGGWLINGLPANERLRRYLARAIAWPDRGFDRQLAALTEVTFFPEDA